MFQESSEGLTLSCKEPSRHPGFIPRPYHKVVSAFPNINASKIKLESASRGKPATHRLHKLPFPSHPSSLLPTPSHPHQATPNNLPSLAGSLFLENWGGSSQWNDAFLLVFSNQRRRLSPKTTAVIHLCGSSLEGVQRTHSDTCY